MAKPILDACPCAGKCISPNFTTIDPKGHGIDAPGLVKHWGITFDVQIRVVGLVQDTDSVSIQDLIDALPGHPAPAEAIEAMVDAGLFIRERGFVSPHTRISLPPRSATNGAGGDIPPGEDGGNPIERGSNVVTLRSSVVHASAIGFVPEVFVVDIADLRDLPAEIDGNMVYCAVDGDIAYSGKSKKGRARVLGSRLKYFDHLIVIRDAAGLMNERQASICERILCISFAQHLGQMSDQYVPNGGHCDFWEYLQLRHFMSQALCLVKEAGLGFSDIPVVQLLAGPEGDPTRQVDIDPLELDGVNYHLYALGMNAQATEYEGEWIVHAGSEVRSRVQRSSGSVVNNLRHEWLTSGVLEDEGDRFRLTAPVGFTSGSAAANFIFGSKFPNLAAWTRTGDDGAKRLSPAL